MALANKVIIIKPDGEIIEEPSVANDAHDPSFLTQLQRAVGGFIEPALWLRNYKGEPCRVYWNEDARSLKLPVNEAATQWLRDVVGPDAVEIRGPIAVVVGTEEFLRRA